MKVTSILIFLSRICFSCSPNSLPGFIPEVSAQSLGAATVSWDANTESDLAGYKIYYGTSSGSYDTEIDVGNVTSFIIDNLEDGTTHFFAMTAYDDSSNESDFSNEVMFPDNRAPGIWNVVFNSEAILDEPVELDIIAHGDEMFIDNGWTIWGHINRDTTDSGIFILNPERFTIRVVFDAKIIGNGVCIEENRMISVTDPLNIYNIGLTFRTIEFTSNSEKVFINYFDDCWIPNESDANLRIENIMIFN
jgi:hypothetical protein